MSSNVVGHRRAIAEGFIPGQRVSCNPALASHETACLRNASDEDAEISTTLFFANRAPCGPYRTEVGARRTLHLRFNDLADQEPVSRRTSYASIISNRRCRSSYDEPGLIPEIRISRCSQRWLFLRSAYPEESWPRVLDRADRASGQSGQLLV